jgi:hypothetical protein
MPPCYGFYSSAQNTMSADGAAAVPGDGGKAGGKKPRKKGSFSARLHKGKAKDEQPTSKPSVLRIQPSLIKNKVVAMQPRPGLALHALAHARARCALRSAALLSAGRCRCMATACCCVLVCAHAG